MDKTTSILLRGLIYIVLPVLIYACLKNSLLKNTSIYAIYILILFCQVLKNRSIYVTTEIKEIFFFAISAIVAIPIVMFHIDTLNGLMYVVILMIFMIIVILIGKILVCDYNFDKITRIWTILCALIIGIFVVLNITEINANTITAVFYTVDDEFRYRASFGFAHPNFAALSITTLMLLFYIQIKISKNEIWKTLCMLFTVIYLIPLLCTGSRTAIISICAFACFEFSFYLIKKSKDLKKVVIPVMCVLIVLYFSQLDYDKLIANSSGRYELVTNSLNSLSNVGGLIMGYKVNSVTFRGGDFASKGIAVADSWYYTFIVRFGIIGFLLLFIPIVKNLFYIALYIIKNNFDTYPLSAFFALMFYGLTENVLYNQGIALSFLVWVLFFRLIYVKNKKIC